MSEQLEHPFQGRKLFNVEIQREIVVLAADESEAIEIAKRQSGCGGGIEWNDADYSALETEWLPKGWTGAIPFGAGNDKELTCGEIIDAVEDYERSLSPTKAELESMGQQRLV